ncbi:acireductone synthase [Lysobacteraceae bacterium NML71-0210]|nr:acireductone synthase [Xanthomonadaceae bacterium NML71-0210]
MPTTILTDIEGTTGSISFVKDVLFPYARAALPDFIATHQNAPQVRALLEEVGGELGVSYDDPTIAQTLQSWIDQDRKHTVLKALQGMIWQAGYRDGEFTAHIYPDVAPVLRQWHAAGHRLAVYSSGSVPAQKLFFGHSDAGDLLPLFSAFFDTRVGHKRERQSYQRIAAELGAAATNDILFLSDVVEELDAAREAGMRTCLIDRREDYPQPRLETAANGHRRVESFADIAP